VGRPAGTGAGALGTALFALIVVLAIAGFAVTRAVRSGDDLVNTVELSPGLRPDGTARVAFDTAEPDDSVDVLIIDGNPGSDDAQVRALALGESLSAGRHVFSWDGTGDDGERVAPGLYALRVILGQEGRDIKPPGRIRIGGGS
jgi:flagellar hook assembly protein FlgD